MNNNSLISLDKLFDKKIFRIPDYQRGYSWQDLQLDEFWTDILNLLPEREHYTGMISLKKVSIEQMQQQRSSWRDEFWIVENWGYEVYEIVDGQQRLTTLIILINEIVNYFKTKSEYINSIPLTQIVNDYIVTEKPDSKIIKTYRFGYEVDNPSYLYFKHRILSSPNEGTIKETFYTANLNNAKDYFSEKIKQLVEEKGIHELEEIFKKITQKLKFNIYYIDNDFNVFIAFETMNNRGKRLSYLELLKNRLIYLTTIFNVSEDEEQEVRENINKTWSDIYEYLGMNKDHPLNDDEFLQNHWMIYFGYQTRKTNDNKTIPYSYYLLNIYFTQTNINSTSYIPTKIPKDVVKEADEDEEYNIEEVEEEKPKKNKKIHLSINDINDYVNSLKTLIKYWYELRFPSSTTNKEIKIYLDRLNRIGYVNARPLVTVILSKKDISDEKKVECLKQIERFNFLHYRFNGYRSIFNNSPFYNLARDLYRDKITIDDVIAEVSKNDYLSSNNVMPLNSIINVIDKLFKDEGYYTNKNTLKYILYEYERYLAFGTGAPKLLPEDIFKADEDDMCSIEHIYPQTPTSGKWISDYQNFSEEEKKRLTNTLGNLLPLSKRINSSLQNDSFIDKKTGKNRVDDDGIPRGYNNGSHNELEVCKKDKWTYEEILERGMKILNFMEKEWNFKFSNDADRKRVLGLDFLIEPEDENKNVTEILVEEKPLIKKVFNEENFSELKSKSTKDVEDIYKRIEEYILALDSNISHNTTKFYVAFTNHKVFVEFHFKSNYATLYLMPGDYNDPLKKVSKVNMSYNWINNNRMDVYPNDDLEYVFDIITQSYQKTIN